MKSDINTKLNQMSATELKEIIDNSFLYDTEIVEKAKELLASKDTQSAPVVENIEEIAPAPSRKKGIMITGISAIAIVIALFAVVFGIRVNNANKYILVEETCDNELSTYEYEFDFLNRITKRYKYMPNDELQYTAIYDKNGHIIEEYLFDEIDTKYEYEKDTLVKQIFVSSIPRTTYTLKNSTNSRNEWLVETDGEEPFTVIDILNSQGDAVETTYGDTKICFEYEYDNNDNRIKSVLSAFMNGEKIQPDSATYYTYMTVEEYKNRTTGKTTTVKGNIELRDCNGKVLLTKADIEKAVAVTENDSSYVELTFTASGKKKFASATEQISALGDGQNNIQIYLNNELISAPVVTQRVESDTVNIAPLTSEDATNIANAINDGNYTDGYISYVSNEPNTTPTKEIKVFTNATFDPFEYYSGSNVVGFDIDLINALCDKLGYEAIIEDVEFDAVINGIAEAKADCGIAGIAVTEERKMSVDFSDIYISCYVDYGEGNIEQDFAIAFPKGSSLIGEFNSAIELAKTDGTIDALVEKWNISTVD